MADSTVWITACTGDRQFLDHLLENQTVAQEIALESSPVVGALFFGCAKAIAGKATARNCWKPCGRSIGIGVNTTNSRSCPRHLGH